MECCEITSCIVGVRRRGVLSDGYSIITGVVSLVNAQHGSTAVNDMMRDAHLGMTKADVAPIFPSAPQRLLDLSTMIR